MTTFRALLFLVLCSAVALAQNTGNKVIKDPAEFNAFMTARGMTDAARKAAAMEAFAAQYPNSIVLTDALEQAMAAYQQMGNTAKVREMAHRLVSLEPKHVQALAILVFLDRTDATNGSAAALREGCAYSATGLQQLSSWQKPDGTSEEDFATMRRQMSAIFEGAAGFCALTGKDFAAAREHYLRALQSLPTDYTNSYQLAVAELSNDFVDNHGFWHCARAINLVRSQNNQAAVAAMNTYCQAKYVNYHGSDAGWQDFVRQYGAQSTAPDPVSVSEKTAVCQLAVEAVQKNAMAELSFSDREFILAKRDCSPANHDAADKVWQSLQAMQKNGQVRLQIPVKVIHASAGALDVAVSEDYQHSNQPDMVVTLETAADPPPAPGSLVNVIGVLVSYELNPFRLKMEKAAVASADTLKK